jgi:hypothetical protein
MENDDVLALSPARRPTRIVLKSAELRAVLTRSIHRVRGRRRVVGNPLFLNLAVGVLGAEEVHTLVGEAKWACRCRQISAGTIGSAETTSITWSFL